MQLSGGWLRVGRHVTRLTNQVAPAPFFPLHPFILIHRGSCLPLIRIWRCPGCLPMLGDAQGCSGMLGDVQDAWWMPTGVGGFHLAGLRRVSWLGGLGR